MQFQRFSLTRSILSWKRSRTALIVLGVTQPPITLVIRSSSAVGCLQKSANTTATAQLSTWVQSLLCWELLSLLRSNISAAGLKMPAMAETLESAGFLVAPTSFGEMPVSRFLLPFQSLRQQAVQRVLTNIRTARELYTPDKISVITHSFGTYVVARILQKEAWHWHRIIFCGSVVPQDFPLDEVRDRFTPPLLNEVGTRDIWPAMAACVTWGYGSIGSFGFNHPAVRTRWHEGFRHSDFLTPDFCKKYWIPFLRDGTIVKGSDKPSRLPWTIRAITKIPLRWIFLLLCLGLPGLAVWHFLYGGPLRLIFKRSTVRKNFQFQFITTLRCRAC